jgi:hypothetical protein
MTKVTAAMADDGPNRRSQIRAAIDRGDPAGFFLGRPRCSAGPRQPAFAFNGRVTKYL